MQDTDYSQDASFSKNEGESVTAVGLMAEAIQPRATFAQCEIERGHGTEYGAQFQNFEGLAESTDGVTAFTEAVLEGQLCRL